MSAIPVNDSAWAKLVKSNIFIEFIDTTLRGCSQVMFQSNPLTGLLFFVAIFIGAYTEGIPAVAFGCLLGTAISTFVAYVGIDDRKSLRAGLFGYNGCLLGAALPTFLATSPVMWACLVLGSIVTVIATISLADFLKNWKVAALTAPFVLTTWVILLASYSFSGVMGAHLPAPALPHEFVPTVNSVFDSISMLDAMFNGVSQVFLFSSIIGGIIFLIGLAVESIWAAVFGLVGTLLALLTSVVLFADPGSINIGLYSFSAVLTAIALGSTFNKPSWKVFIYTIVGVIFTVFVQGALDTTLAPLGIPTLTMPFVLTSWLFLVPNKDIVPEHRK
ncbi:urea transporter [Budvicia aquatica]|uniref:urea transporter n=1 Tax=Budvicia aquatica TaxID=82979 RepID=UPI001B687AE4|nr:urea transporter [Budvicia aquatica]MBP9643108.1 urea transporter [Budvicia sp.]GKX53005.1 urea transporter [Budvicia aquatica]